MSIKTIIVKKFSELIAILNKSLSNEDLIFRGQLDSKWALSSTLNRHLPLKGQGDPIFESIISKFIASVAKISDLPYPIEDKISWMEYGQHQGLPTPCIDFSYSPFIALFFAFDGIKKSDDSSASIFILNKKVLALHYAEFKATKNRELNEQECLDYKNTFLNPTNIEQEIKVSGNNENVLPFFAKNGFFPFDKLQFFPHPKHNNHRMIRQQGCFVYDTLNYQSKISNFESFCNSVDFSTKDGLFPVLTKLEFPHKFASKSFAILEAMNINSSMLYLDHSAAARDVKNTFFYNPKSMDVG